ncbi:MAG TPA: putative toxin-antitoxin system toxin component, PIN family [Spirochaetota bacterium]|nr:putative toxin-antitoxin system toxin component, PIN family [Spirochaetota bacterium]HNU90828.1 putative toxin-antitoxin system toxin component, PIN family [Spirochaetota bacterium]HPV97182.1 putative toxin-antitoxin system toxin component, PIN family [Spirochaetota bacterium]
MIVVLDTNVLYQALRGSNGASFFILSLIRDNKISMALSIPVFNEYEKVLTRPASLKDLNLSLSDIEKVLKFVAYIGRPYTTYFLFRPNLLDESDNIFVELSLVSNCDFLITSNVKDFTTKSELKFDDITIITPSEFVKVWRTKNES